MKTTSEINAMREHAYVMTLNATDRARLGEDTTTNRAYAEGVEAALLWALGHIGEIPDFILPRPIAPSTERVEVGADGCGCPVTGEVTVVDGELRGDVEGTDRTEHRPGCWAIAANR